MLNIVLAGAQGRMGQKIAAAIKADPHTQLVGSITRDKIDLPQNSAVLIDFSIKEALDEHVKLCQAQGLPMVIGITGLSKSQHQLLRTAAQNLPILYAANMSLGMNLSFRLLQEASKILSQLTNNANGPLTDIAISEIHHRHKKDAPSGTALTMRGIIEQTFTNKRDIPISSLRFGEVKGEHKVYFDLGDEQIEISHIARDSNIFAQGALLAAKWLVQKPPGLYDMKNVLGF